VEATPEHPIQETHRHTRYGNEASRRLAEAVATRSAMTSERLRSDEMSVPWVPRSAITSPKPLWTISRTMMKGSAGCRPKLGFTTKGAEREGRRAGNGPRPREQTLRPSWSPPLDTPGARRRTGPEGCHNAELVDALVMEGRLRRAKSLDDFLRKSARKNARPTSSGNASA